jgi:hypothetical protein
MSVTHANQEDGGRQRPESRVVRACDNCALPATAILILGYKSKNKCLLSPQSQTCENCKFFGLECTFLREKKKRHRTERHRLICRGPPKGYIDAIESKLILLVTLMIDRIGRIETILYSVVEQQQKAGLAPAGMLSDVSREVKQLQTMSTGSENEDSPTQTMDPVQDAPTGFTAPMGQQNANILHPMQPSSIDDRPMLSGRRYTDSGVNIAGERPQMFSTAQSSQTTMNVDFTGEREFQRRRFRPPTPTGQAPSQGHDTDAEGDNEISHDSQIIQMAGQLSLDENKTVRYHGASSGLTLLTRSKRFDGTFWNLPNPGFWPASDRRTVKTELEIDSKTQLPPIPTQDRLLEYVPLHEMTNHKFVLGQHTSVHSSVL